ncbi:MULTISPECIES: tRNA threonylcarbamoyladenosine dehydratase [Francisella]|uniref:tRNA threonylcarbamoyladenosine dehydratase n=1 Tax=Francisella opportunistica TaxID=2016517 RepID=A0A345JR10_9GAMM|nr:MULTISPECIES: tRNA threonylcarbamoyladenosine dehydratase [Francisella]APC91471.1 HesA/MoeB/ThiF family protein [Francisella sp. MA067296]AXH29756.1 tRNA threonylcarbamoyladenosine dehydratase [Francisella opportunistica]AXH31406.1 tRNA threonylcarbamoyladenosine dehydratase [Francisella opportunistica]AXH33051.1 tRNA threonylcarbamoyladenosine dehydratase [Francisella opportunistica]
MINAITQRTAILVNNSGLEKLENANIFIAGCGGVGSFVIEALARAGIGKLTIVDMDVVDSSNINRQLIALHSTIGIPKVQVMQQRIIDINPQCQVNALQTFINPDNSQELLTQQSYDYVIDAIDTLNAKVNLVKTAHQLGIKTISSMGAGGKTDPTQIKVADIYNTDVCALARVMRTRLKKQKVKKGIKAVFSTQKNIAPLPPKDPQPNQQGRSRATNGTLSYMPSLFGLTIAGIVIKEIIGNDFNY